jgi:hypothetical protein
MTTFEAKCAVTDLLRPSEKAILVIDTSPDGGTSNPRSPPFQTTRRVLAIVLHESHEQKHGAYVTIHKSLRTSTILIERIFVGYLSINGPERILPHSHWWIALQFLLSWLSLLSD